jgi:hypothetical protein
MSKNFLCLAVVAFVLRVSGQEPPPVVDGQPLNFWLLTLVDKSSSDVQREGARQAIKKAGTNAIPYLLAELSVVERVERSGSPSTDDLSMAIRKSGAATRAFELLGQDASPALPQFAKMMNSGNQNTVVAAARILLGFGPLGVHAIVVGLTNDNLRARASTASALRGAGTNALAEVPFLFHALEGLEKDAAFDCCYAITESGDDVTNLVAGFTSLLKSTNSVTRYVSAMTLGRMGAEASKAVPDLEKLRSDPVKNVRDAADWALARIGNRK